MINSNKMPVAHYAKWQGAPSLTGDGQQLTHLRRYLLTLCGLSNHQIPRCIAWSSGRIDGTGGHPPGWYWTSFSRVLAALCRGPPSASLV
jgi:hypothetical protein